MEFERSLILEGMQFLKQNGFIGIIDSEPSYFENKNSEKSVAVRKQANALFAKKNHDEKVHEEIWKLYTKSIAYAENESEELSAGYANRSALLLHLKKFDECLLDIDRALKITDSSSLKVKLYCRQSECCVALQDGREKDSLEKASFWLGKIDDDKERKSLKGTIEKTERTIKAEAHDSVKREKKHEITCDNNAFRMSYSEKYGKHLVAARDIRIGELLYIEKFYLTTVNSAKIYAYCSHCLAISWATIPCDQCSFYMYCSQRCKKEAWHKYHDIECSLKFGKNPQSYNSYYLHLGLRAFIMGLKETGSIKKLKDLTNGIDKCKDLGKRGLSEDGKFASNSFRSLYSLNFSKSVENVRKYAPKVLELLVAFAQNTNIFGKDFKYTRNTDWMNNEGVIFTATLLLRLSSICCINAFELTSVHLNCEKGNKFLDCTRKFCCSRGLTMSLFTGLINHSCDNNVDKFHTNDGRVVYYALQPIEKNSQIFSSYYCQFFRMSKRERQPALLKLFEFHCDCVACKNNWPSRTDNLPKVHTELGLELLEKHSKLIEKLCYGKKCKRSSETIRSFIQDTELLLKSSNRPIKMTELFLGVLCLLIEHRYFIRLKVPSICKNNSNK